MKILKEYSGIVDTGPHFWFLQCLSSWWRQFSAHLMQFEVWTARCFVADANVNAISCTSSKPAESTTKLWLTTPQCTQRHSYMMTVCWGKVKCLWNNFRSQTTAEFLSFVALISVNGVRKLLNSLLPVATDPQRNSEVVWLGCTVEF